MKKTLFFLFATAALTLAGCEENNKAEGPTLSHDAFSGTLTVLLAQGQPFNSDDIRAEASMQEDKLTLKLIGVRFSPAMPEQVKITLVLRDLACSGSDGNLFFSGTGFNPSMGNNPGAVDFATINSLRGEIRGGELTLSMTCVMTDMAPGTYPITYNGRAIR